jgi:hypothetical protein
MADGTSPSFKVVLVVTVLLTVGCFIGAVLLSNIEEPSKIAQDTADHLLKGGDLGLGAIFGLLGGASL